MMSSYNYLGTEWAGDAQPFLITFSEMNGDFEVWSSPIISEITAIWMLAVLSEAAQI